MKKTKCFIVATLSPNKKQLLDVEIKKQNIELLSIKLLFALLTLTN